MQNLELLAPAGCKKSLQKAIEHGADAVYFGLGQHNARAKAEAFDERTIEFCKNNGVRSYITINTAIKQQEIKGLDGIIEKAWESDALIIADLAVLAVAKRMGYKGAFHASTQMGVHNELGAKVAQDLGFSRVVVSRESTLQDISAIAKLGLEVEYSVHGALCLGFSGGCLFASAVGQKSGNRGTCPQLCRQKFGNDYPLSTKDLCLINKLEQLKNAGVVGLKIEGRNRRPEYVATVVGEYKKALNGQKISTDRLKIAYNRGNFTEGYAFSDPNQIIFSQAPNHIGLEVGVVERVIGKDAQIKITNAKFAPKKGDGFKILRGGVEIFGGVFGGNLRVFCSKQPVKVGDKFCITSKGGGE